MQEVRKLSQKGPQKPSQSLNLGTLGAEKPARRREPLFVSVCLSFGLLFLNHPGSHLCFSLSICLIPLWLSLLNHVPDQPTVPQFLSISSGQL